VPELDQRELLVRLVEADFLYLVLEVEQVAVVVTVVDRVM